MTNNIRNFCILAHIDHGKSTLADRFLEITGTVEKRKMREQFLDMNPLEREKGITIKMQPVRMEYDLRGTKYILNLIDTPGHVDFSYEVSRALAAVEGAILLVDATQGIQAQTVANLHLAQKAAGAAFAAAEQAPKSMVIIPAINKIDLSSAEIKKTEEEISDLLQIPRDEILKVSGKAGTGVENLLRQLIQKVPAPLVPDTNLPLRALIFDSVYDPYQGAIAFVRVFSGTLCREQIINFLATGEKCKTLEVGIFSPARIPKDKIGAGEIGYVSCGIKEPEKIRVGDTITDNPSAVRALPGYKEPQPVVFASVFPENQDDYDLLRDSLNKLKLNDAAVIFTPESGGALGRGFRMGFLGLLHMEIISERLRREYGLTLVFSNPSVVFRVELKEGIEMIYSPAKMPPSHKILSIAEQWIQVEVVTPAVFLGGLTSLVNESGGKLLDTSVLAGERLRIKFEAPLREIVIDFYDKLKSVSRGFASMAYEIADFRTADLIKLNILIAGEEVPTLAEIVPREKAYRLGRSRVQKLKELLPRELFAITLQAESGGKIIARETIPALKKDVTGYLYGGDRTRKMKLWKKQQKGKKRLLSSARVDIPPEVFLEMLKTK